MMTTLYPYKQAYDEPLPNRQGRSKKSLRPVIEFDGHVFIARWEGRPGSFFGATDKEALSNLQAGGQ
jgi:hypothetical protein